MGYEDLGGRPWMVGPWMASRVLGVGFGRGLGFDEGPTMCILDNLFFQGRHIPYVVLHN